MTDEPSPPASLGEALAGHGIELPPEKVDELGRYCQLLWQWNEKINLTRHTDYGKFVARDLVDSMALERLIDSGDRVLDVGTGGGVPGIVLRTLRDDLEVVLSESVAKKAKAVADIAENLNNGVRVVHARAEDLLDSERFDTLVVRAVAPLAKLLTWFTPHWDSIGQLLVIKGPKWIQERHEAKQRNLLCGVVLRKAAEYTIPGTPITSVILRLTPADR